MLESVEVLVVSSKMSVGLLVLGCGSVGCLRAAGAGRELATFFLVRLLTGGPGGSLAFLEVLGSRFFFCAGFFFCVLLLYPSCFFVTFVNSNILLCLKA